VDESETSKQHNNMAFTLCSCEIHPLGLVFLLAGFEAFAGAERKEIHFNKVIRKQKNCCQRNNGRHEVTFP